MYNLETMKKVNFLPGTKVLEEIESPINGKIVVLKSLGLGTYIQVEGLTQSGGVMHGVWRTTLKKIKNRRQEVKDSLILGLGGGTAASLIKKYWPEITITGVDIDPVIVDLGKKYLGMPEVERVIGDAYEYCQQQEKSEKRYDLILVDVYVGYEVPKKFQREKFIKLVKSLLTKNGIIVFNRLYFDEKRSLAMKFSKKLEKIFPKVETVFPEANIMFICST
jgi:spermidine synthase